MATKTDVDGMSAAILEEMNKYKDVTIEIMQEAVIATAKEAVQRLKESKPADAEKYGSWNDYLKGWDAVADKNNKNKLSYKMIIHNKTKYRLAHLLEHGHAMVNGGRAKSFKHIEPVENMCEKLLFENIMKGLEKN